MKFVKFLGWAMLSLVLLAGLTYGLLPTIGSMLVTQQLSNHGFTNVMVTINYPSFHELTIPSLVFHVPQESGATSISMDDTQITYSLVSLFNKAVHSITIEHMRIVWDSSLLEKSSAPSPSLPNPPTDSQFDFSWLASGTILPVLPFQHAQVKRLDISNPLTPPGLQQISSRTRLTILEGALEGTLHLEGKRLPLNLLSFSLTENGVISFTGTHTNAPKHPVPSLETSLARSVNKLTLHGKTILHLHPLIQTFAALYPIPPVYQSLTGTFSGSWSSTLSKNSSQAGLSIGPTQGNFSLDAHLPTWSPFAQDIQLRTQGDFFLEGPTLTVILQPSSTGHVHLSLDSLFSPSFRPFLSHNGLRSFTWNIQQPFSLVIPLTQNLDMFQIPRGEIQIAMQNPSEQLNIVLSSQHLLIGSQLVV